MRRGGTHLEKESNKHADEDSEAHEEGRRRKHGGVERSRLVPVLPQCVQIPSQGPERAAVQSIVRPLLDPRTDPSQFVCFETRTAEQK